MLVVTNCAKNYASPIFQSVLQNAGDATISIIPLIPYPVSHICITLVRVKTGYKISLLFADNNVNYLCSNLHNCMILSETLIEEFPRRRRQIIIKKCPRELFSPFADHPGVYLIKQNQF